jgi:hypothetical protein
VLLVLPLEIQEAIVHLILLQQLEADAELVILVMRPVLVDQAVAELGHKMPGQQEQLGKVLLAEPQLMEIVLAAEVEAQVELEMLDQTPKLVKAAQEYYIL